MKISLENAIVTEVRRTQKGTYLAELLESAGGFKSVVSLSSKDVDLTALPVMVPLDIIAEVAVRSYEGRPYNQVVSLSVKK